MKLLFVSLGCDKNLVDTEHMLPLLVEEGFKLTDDEEEADIIVVNTCCFIGDAMEESIQTLIELGGLKENGNLKALIATGCLAQRFSEEIREQIPEVDGIVGTNGFDEIVSAIRAALSGRYPRIMPELSGIPETGGRRLLTTGGHYAYLKIAEGCDKRCTYCIIPYIRGGYRSVPMEEILKEAELLAEDGATELILVAQETTVYGVDLYGKKSLARLLDELNRIETIRQLRIMYAYPEEIDDELVSAISRNKKVVHYIDMPIQHCNDLILKRMGRRTTGDDIRNIISMLRSRIPDIAIRTTLITGFPGEGEAEFEEMLDFIREIRFDRLGVFAYSPQEGTAAAGFSDQIDEDTKRRRLDILMQEQQQISLEKNRELVGTDMEAFIIGRVADEDDIYAARTYRDAPDVDGMVFVDCPHELISGRYIRVRITGASEYDLIGET